MGRNEVSMKRIDTSLRPKQAAEFLGIGESTFWRWAKERPDFPAGIKLSPRTTVFPLEQLTAWRDAQAEKSARRPPPKCDDAKSVEFRVNDPSCIKSAIEQDELDRLKEVAESWLSFLLKDREAQHRIAMSGEKWTDEEISTLRKAFYGAGEHGLTYGDWTTRRDEAAAQIRRTRHAVSNMAKRLGYRIAW
jgi:predicted DNA-binding transcriptional regulator AlpA